MSVATTRSRVTTAPAKETVLASAVDLARSAAEELALPGQVGEHRGVIVEGERLLTHVFEALVPGYQGWHWAVTVARPPRGRTATICEVELLPGDGAILAPDWVPWADRLSPDDVGPSDVLPYVEEDERLEQGFEATGEEDLDQLAIFELGLGRKRVLSREGRAQALNRWYEGDRGPFSPAAKSAKAPCSTCGFFMKLAGSPRTMFGVCANEWSPDDGRVVAVDHGCGAHSETKGPQPVALWQTSDTVVNELDLEVVSTEPAPAKGSADKSAKGSADKSAKRMGEQPAKGMGERAPQGTAGKPAQDAGEKPTESVGEKATHEAGGKAAELVAEQPAKGAVGESVTESAKAPAEESAEAPAEDSVSAASDVAAEAPAAESANEPAEQPEDGNTDSA